MIEKKATIDGRTYTFRSSALIPRLYRAKFGRDMIQDMRKLAEAYKEAQGDPEKVMSMTNLEVFENIAWLMLKYAGEPVLETPEQWLESLDTVFSVYEVFPVILELWHRENQTTSKPRKK